MANPKVKFIGWNKSALELVGENLLALAKDKPDAFRRATIVVPTAESGRRLKEWLAEKAGKPLLMPRVALAGQLIQADGEHVATELETLAAWVEVLTEGEPHEVWQGLFPGSVPGQHLQEWALGTADSLMKLQLQLEQYELTVDDVLHTLSCKDELPNDFAQRWCAVAEEEMEHWLELKRLFKRVDERLAAWGKTPGWVARAEALEAPAAPQGPLVIVACLPELSPQVQHYLKHLEEASPGRVRIWVNAPEKLYKKFDIHRCGCINVDAWSKYLFRPRVLNDKQIHVKSSARSLARATLETLCAASSGREVVLGTCDASYTPALVTELAEYGWKVHLPEGRSARNTELYALPGLLAAACEAPASMSVMGPLLKNTAMQYLWGGKLRVYDFCRLLDKLQQRYYADSFSYFLSLLDPDKPLPAYHHSTGSLPGSPDEPHTGKSNEREVGELEKLRSRSFFQYALWVQEFVSLCGESIERGFASLETAMRRAYRGHVLQPVASVICGLVKQMSKHLSRHPLPPREAWTMLRHLLAQQSVALQETAREKTHVDALGWRELPYAAGSQLIITGLHEGCVPEALAVDPFLPDSLRQLLGLPCTVMREARDTFLLASLLHRDKVSVHFILAQQSADGSGTPVAPSGLLYRCPDNVLAGRVKDKLFVELTPEEQESYAAWSLSPKDAQPGGDGMESVQMISPAGWVNPFSLPEHRFSPSEINGFLACPLRFWMKYALGISSWDEYKGDNKVEMTPAEYGTLMHNVLEDVARRYPRKEQVTDKGEVLDFAVDRLSARCRERFGDRHMLPTILRQISHIRSGLDPFVDWHCRALEDGWVCYDCEHKVKDWSLTLPDETRVLISMRADRIDYKPETNEWRVVDYKTHSELPIKKHLVSIPERKLPCLDADDSARRDGFDRLMGVAGFELYEGKKYWRDVQLPMYAAWLQETMQCELPEVGYFNLPRAGHDNEGYNSMPELTDDALESSLEWAKNAIMMMRDGLCLYSAESLGLSAPGASPEDDEGVDPRNLFANLRKIF